MRVKAAPLPMGNFVGSCKERSMLDLIMLAIGLGLFALSVAYVYACNRL
jgi:hypothetical protein